MNWSFFFWRNSLQSYSHFVTVLFWGSKLKLNLSRDFSFDLFLDKSSRITGRRVRRNLFAEVKSFLLSRSESQIGLAKKIEGRAPNTSHPSFEAPSREDHFEPFMKFLKWPEGIEKINFLKFSIFSILNDITIVKWVMSFAESCWRLH